MVELEDQTGEVYRPSLTDRMVDLLSGQERKRRKFWTPERIELAQKVVEDVCQRTETYGVKPLSFNPSQIKLVDELKGGRTIEIFLPSEGRILLATSAVRKEKDFVSTLAHVYYHVVSFRKGEVWVGGLLRSKVKGKGRFGFDFLKRESGGLKWLGEGIVDRSAEITTERVLGYEVFEVAYSERKRIVKDFCYQIALREMTQERKRLKELDPEEVKKRAEEVFEDFERALYGRGELLPISRRINHCYEKWGGFRAFVEKVEELSRIYARLKEEKNPGKRYQLFAEHRKAYEDLRNFARKPFPKIPGSLELSFYYFIPPEERGISPFDLMFLIKKRLGEDLALCSDDRCSGPIRIRKIDERFFKDKLGTSGQKIYCPGWKGMDGRMKFIIKDDSLWDQIVDVITSCKNLVIEEQRGKFALVVRDKTIS